jgi:hypothetical protein
MALARKNPSKLYDSQGREIFAELPQVVLYKNALGTYLEQIYAESAQDLTTFESLLFPNKPSTQTLKDTTAALFQRATQLATEAVKLRQGGWFGYGADEVAYNKSAAELKNLGEYIENIIIETPWYIPISKKSYVLTALKDSPENFLKLKDDKVVTAYVENLNSAKRTFPTEKITQKNLPVLSKQYAENVLQARDYKGMASNFISEIQTIETQRLKRGSFINFFVDLFTGQDKKLEKLNIRKKALEALTGFTKTTENVSTKAQFQSQGNRFLKTPASFKLEEIAALQLHLKALSSDKTEAANLALFIKRLEESIFSNLNNLGGSPDISALINQLRFLAEKNLPENLEALNVLHKKVSNYIKKMISYFDHPKDGLEYISKWKKIPTPVLQTFDPNLEQDIQNQKNKYKKLRLIQMKWDSLLNDKLCKQLSADDVNELIRAILWLDKPKENTDGIDVLRNKLIPDKLTYMQVETKNKLVALGKSFDQALSEIANNTLSDDKKSALIKWLQFILPANSTLTSELDVLHEKFITNIVTHLKSKLSLQELKKYLDTINTILPKELKEDKRLSAAIKEVKPKWLEASFSEEQNKLHKKFKDEIEFLKTGDLSLWEKMQCKLTGENRRELTKDNIKYWKENFLIYYVDALRIQQQYDSVLSDGDPEDKKIIKQMLDESIADEFRSISSIVDNDLEQLTNVSRKMAFERLDKIFALKPTQSVDLNMFMLRYAVVSAYQAHYSKYPDGAALIEANREFVRKFNKVAQISGGFTTEIVAKLPKAALEAMYASWADNPNIVISSARDAAPLHLVHDIANPVVDQQGTHIKSPKFLLLRMVSELIDTDFEAILRGDKVDLTLLKDRLKFVLPKLSKQRQTFETSLNEQSHDLRETLITELNKLNTGTTNERYSKIIADHMEATNVKADWTSWKKLNNQYVHEQVLLEQLKSQISGLLSLFSTLKPEDIECRFGVDDVKEVESKLKDLQAQKNLSSDQLEIELLDVSIQKLTDKKQSMLRMIRTSEAKKLCLQRYTDYLVGDTRKKLHDLLDNDSISLKDFIQKVNVELFSLIDDDKLASTCVAIRKNTELQNLLKEKRYPYDKIDEILTEKIARLLEDLHDPNTDIIKIVNSINESMASEFPAETADMISQLQYFFADYTITNLAKTLGKEHVEKCRNAHSRAGSLGLFQGATPEARLKTAFEFLGKELVKQLFEVLSSSKVDEKKVAYIHNLTGVSAPKNIRRIV